MTYNYRDWFLSLVAVAGTATAAVVIYKYAKRGAHIRVESNTQTAADTQECEDVNDESISQDEFEEIQGVQQEEQQFEAANRERSVFLVMFGLMLAVLVTIASLLLVWSNENEFISFVELPLFQPLIWIAFGIVTAAGIGLFNYPLGDSQNVRNLEEKAVFPPDASESELVRLRGGDFALNVDDNYTECLSSALCDEEEKECVPENIADIIKRADDLFEMGQHGQTLDFLETESSKFSSSIGLLWRLARACNYLVEKASTFNDKRTLAFKGLAYAEKAYALNSDLAVSNKWMAILTSTVGNFRDLKEKIAGAYVIRDYIQRAIELDPTDATSHNILGQWCLAFADMTWMEKRAATVLFGTPPTATYEEAIKHFRAAENISPGFWKKNVFLLAQTNYKMKQDKEAAIWLKRANAVPVKTKEDEQVARDIAALMKQLKLH